MTASVGGGTDISAPDPGALRSACGLVACNALCAEFHHRAADSARKNALVELGAPRAVGVVRPGGNTTGVLAVASIR